MKNDKFQEGSEFTDPYLYSMFSHQAAKTTYDPRDSSDPYAAELAHIAESRKAAPWKLSYRTLNRDWFAQHRGVQAALFGALLLLLAVFAH